MFTLDNLPEGTVRGWVYKGPAYGVEVTAQALGADGVPGAVLATARTDGEAAFELPIAEYRGAILLTARGAADGTSQFRNEAGAGELLSWDVDETLSSIVPDFDPAAGGGRTVLVTPLTDLAVARARGLASDDFMGAYGAALTALGAHFGVDDPLHTRPLSPDADAHRPPTQGDVYLLALACLSQQARDLAPLLSPAAPESVSPLGLVAVYRADLAADGVLDGRAGATPLPNGWPENAFRVELARACARWLGGAANPTGLTTAETAEILDGAISGDTSDLFDPDQPAAPFDSEGPDIAPLVFTTVEGAIAGETVRGPILVTVDAVDPSGVSRLDVTLEPAVPGALSPLDAAVTGHQVWLFDARLAPDGALEVVVTATDGLGHVSTRRTTRVVDQRAPRLSVNVDGAAVAEGSRIITRGSPSALEVVADEAATVRIRVDGAIVETRDVGAGEVYPVDLLWRVEGTESVGVEAADALGNTSDPLDFSVTYDITPPTLAVVPTRFVDERRLDRWPLPDDLAASGLPFETIDEDTFADGAPLEVARQIHRWNDEGAPANPVVLAVRADDGVGAGGVGVTWRRAPGGCFLLDDPLAPTRGMLSAPRPAVLRVDGTFGLSLTAETLDFDPVDPRASARTTVCLELSARDAAGNSAARVFEVEAVRVAPVMEVVEVDARALRAPRLGDVDGTMVAALFNTAPGDAGILSVAAFAVRNPSVNLSVWVDIRPAEDAEIVAEPAALELLDGPFVGGFNLPWCFLDYSPIPADRQTWPFLSPNAAGGWDCAPMATLDAAPSHLPLVFGQAVADGAWGPLSGYEPGRGPADPPTLVTIGLRPVAASASLSDLLAAGAEPALGGAEHAVLVQGPGRTAVPIEGCQAAPCEQWYTLARGVRLGGVRVDLHGPAWAVYAHFGPVVSLRLATAGPADWALQFPLP